MGEDAKVIKNTRTEARHYLMLQAAPTLPPSPPQKKKLTSTISQRAGKNPKGEGARKKPEDKIQTRWAMTRNQKCAKF